MKMQYIFYVIGVIFIFISTIYFAKEFIVNLPKEIKLILLILSIIVTFTLAEFFRGSDL